MATYKTCAVPMCKNTTIKHPEKLFIHVPKCPKRRKQWLQLARRDSKVTSGVAPIYFCEDHFDLPNDMENYIRYSVMGAVGKIRMKPDSLPFKFSCQPGRIESTGPPQPRSAVSERLQMDVTKGFSQVAKMPTTSGMAVNSEVHSITEKDNCGLTVNTQNKATQLCPEVTNTSIQVCLKTKMKSKAIQTTNQENTSTPTSPFKTTESGIELAKFRKRKLLFSSENSEMSCARCSSFSKHSRINTDTSPSVQSLLAMTSTSSNQETQSELSAIKIKIETEDLCRKTIENTLRLIKNNPGYYIGISKECYFLIELIQRYTKLPEEHLLLCLKKIRLNTPFSELGDQFGISQSNANEIFMESVPFISRVLHPFIIKSNKRAITHNLPVGFRHKYHDIYCVIDCLEIEIEEPSKSVEQDLTCSEYKKANTAKYLISSTPDGVINYISPGYSGRITDLLLVENCNFLDCLEPGVSILADREFKQLEDFFLQKGINLVRLPSISSKSKSKQDVIKRKQIVSLRNHIERVIRGLREFSMLKPHSVVSKNMLKYFDHCTVIACGLINLQDRTIKNTTE